MNFLKNQEAYFLVDVILAYFSTGNHEAYAFREFEMPPNYIADYLLVGKNSGGYEFIFVELESPQGNISNKSGEFGSTIRKGLKQIEEWSTWIDANFSHLKLMFDKYKNVKHILPNEFLELDKSRVHFVVVAGRRGDFKEKTYRLRRKQIKECGALVLHYDNLIDDAISLLNEEIKQKKPAQ